MPKKLIFLDCETTGLDEKDQDGYTLLAHEIHSVIELSGIVDIDGKIADRFTLFAAPKEGDVVSQEALNVNGRTKEEVQDFPPQMELYKGLLQVLGKHVDAFDKEDKFYFVGYNCIRFDEPFIRQLFQDFDDKYYGSWFWHPTIDVMQIAAIVLMETEARHLISSMSLSSVAGHLGFKFNESSLHSAMYDCRITRQIYYKLTS